jgi:hypothetical protein
LAKRRPSKADRKIDPIPQLALCIVMDIIGAATYLLPMLGELADIIYAPIQFVVALSLFGGERWGTVWAGVAFAEELLPFTDIFPSMTLGWVGKYML